MLPKQGIFNKVYLGLASQNWAFSYDEEKDLILYRHPNGYKCAIGWLLNDEFYSEDLEGLALNNYDPNWKNNPYKRQVRDGLIGDLLIASGVPAEHLDFVEEIQNVHDLSMPSSLKRNIEKFAKENGLDIPDDYVEDVSEGPHSWKPGLQ